MKPGPASRGRRSAGRTPSVASHPPGPSSPSAGGGRRGITAAVTRKKGTAPPAPGKMSFSFDQQIWGILDVRNPTPEAATGGGVRGEIVREILRRYDDVCRAHLPKFSADEWRVLLASSDGWWRTPGRRPSGLISALVDADRRPGGGGPGDKIRKDLLARLLSLSVVETVAVADELERRWAAVTKQKC